ncbi:MAG: ProQ activator of osmoprotectant transporter prop [Rhodocyclaceae bacterium]|nr:ProQ activator of osmoprotectant transporter prop [Rhodocyclaceae bacterium]
MTVNDKPTPPKDAARQLLKDLQSRFPILRDAKPMAIGIDAEILAAIPEVDKKTLRTALRMHTGATRYLKSMAREEKRYNLAGEPVSDLAEEHRARAKAMLKERNKRREEEEKARREQEAAQRRNEKLEQLAARFSRDNK